MGPKLGSDEVAGLAEALGLAEEEIQATNQPARVRLDRIAGAHRPGGDPVGALRRPSPVRPPESAARRPGRYARVRVHEGDAGGTLRRPRPSVRRHRRRRGAGRRCRRGRAGGLPGLPLGRYDPAGDVASDRAGALREPAVDHLHRGAHGGRRDREGRHRGPRHPRGRGLPGDSGERPSGRFRPASGVACSHAPAANPGPSLGEHFWLQAGESVAIRDERATVTFDRIVVRQPVRRGRPVHPGGEARGAFRLEARTGSR